MTAEDSTDPTLRKRIWDCAAFGPLSKWRDRVVQLTATHEDHQRSLRSKLVLSLAAMCGLFLLIDLAVQRMVIQPAFEDLDRASASQYTQRVLSALEIESAHLRSVAQRTVAMLDDTPRGAMPPSNAENRPWPTIAWSIDGVQWAAIASSNGSWTWIDVLPTTASWDRSNRSPIGVEKNVLEQIALSRKTSIDGLVCENSGGVHLYGATQIDPDDKADAAAASQASDDDTTFHLVVGKQLDRQVIDKINQCTHVVFSVQPLRKPGLDDQIHTRQANQSTLVVEAPIVKHEGRVLANLTIQVPRDVAQQASRPTSLARHIFLYGDAATLLLMMLLLQRIVISPLKRIREHAERIADSGLDAASLEMTSNDEIGALAAAFDRMKHRLADAQKRLADASHAAGMSQVADTVIHNVGNVLTNVNSLIETAVDRVDGLRVAPLEKLATRLQQDDNREALILATPEYLRRLAAQLENDQRTLADLLSTLSVNVQHIHSVIRDQHRHTLKSVETKRFSIRQIVDEAVNCCLAKLKQDEIQIYFDEGIDYDVVSDWSLLLQVFINLIGNAGNSMSEGQSQQRLLDISIDQQGENVRVQIRDHGCGMTEETLGNVFNAFFTTRSSGTGLGLHFCANAMKRLGGSLSAHSDGLGHGSTFTIQLPLVDSDRDKAPAPIAPPLVANDGLVNNLMDWRIK